MTATLPTVVTPSQLGVDPASFGAAGDGVTDDTTALAAAITAADGTVLNLRPGTTYLYSSISKTVSNGITINGNGATLKSTLGKLVNTTAFWIKGSDVTIKDVCFDFTVAVDVATDASSRGDNAITLRLGGSSFGSLASRIVVKNVKVNNSRNTPILAQYADRMLIEGCTLRNAYGNGIFIGDSGQDIRIIGNSIYNTGDDGIGVYQNTATGARMTNVTIANNTVDTSDAKGIGCGITNGSITGNTVKNTFTGGIQLIEDTVFTLYGNQHVTVAGNSVENAGKCFGARDGVGHGSASTIPHGILVTGGSNTDVSITGNTVKGSQGRGIQVDGVGAESIVIDGNVVRTAGDVGIGVGNPDGSSYTDQQNVSVTGNVVRDVVGGIVVGTLTGCVISGNSIRSFKSGAAGSRRGILVGKTTNCRVVGNVVNNDDGAAATIYDYNKDTPGNNVNLIVENNTEITAGSAGATNVTQVINYAATITPVWEQGRIVKVGALTGNITVNVPSDPIPGARIMFIFTEDATGGRTITFAGGYKVNWTPDTAANKVNTIEFVYDTTTGYWRQIGAATGLT